MSEGDEFLLDASAVVKLLLDGEDDQAFGHAVLELGFFEVANTLYRIAAHEQRLSRDDADLLVEQLADLRNEIELLSLQDVGGIARVYETAWNTSLTVYDAGHVAAATSTKRTLVTTDSGIHDHAPPDVAVDDIDVLIE
ncbi:type II toxin-antitoxin system VapC family toxin [Halococcus sp. PRR34]|uniref:type II toxin-antitoxin system VapC family toxin n=1 Tax=Halococcus sp. PRR34 TaxID=3020830 RepID=UPI00235FEB6F|nr:type II toxin-antitoxin system VapC family toxin [Halococcus sp. PRR34]